MTEVFGRGYADSYDALYHAKDYEGEVDLIERFLNGERATGARRVLDMDVGPAITPPSLSPGAGISCTASMIGGHASSRSPKAAALAGQSAPVFHQSDIRDIDLGDRASTSSS